MIKVYFSICITILFITGSYAQQTLRIKTPVAKTKSNSANARHNGGNNSPMQVAGTIVCNSVYVAGTTMNLDFTISTTNTDGEYIDSLAITFPAGFTIDTTSACPSFPSADTITSGGPEHFNGIFNSRHSISWGSHVNDIDSAGGIWANPPQNFSIKVAISSTVTGVQMATFFAHGDGYPHTLGDSTSGNLSGTINISPPAPNDLGAVCATVTNGCALSHTATVSFKFLNVGTSAQSNFNLGYVVNGGTVVTETYTPIINPNDTAVYSFITPIAMVADTIYTVKVFTGIAGDANPANDTTSTVGYTSHNVPYSSGFEADQHDLLGWSSQHISGSGSIWTVNSDYPHAGDFSAYLFSGVTGVSDDWLFSPCINFTQGPMYQVKFYTMRYNADSTYSGQLKVWLTNGTSIGDTINLLLAIDTVQPGSSSSQYQVDSVLFTVPATGTYILSFEGKNMDPTRQVALLLDDVGITYYGYAGIKTIINNSTDIIIYPNPTTGVLNITTTAANANIEVYNVMGQNVLSKTLNNGTNTIDIGNLNNGVYCIQIFQNNTLTISKVVKTN
jgi:type IX secretion system substrate protein